MAPKRVLSFMWTGEEAKIKASDIETLRELAKTPGGRVYVMDILVDVKHEADALHYELLTKTKEFEEVQCER